MERKSKKLQDRKSKRLKRGSPEWLLLLALRRALALILGALEKYMGLN